MASKSRRIATIIQQRVVSRASSSSSSSSSSHANTNKIHQQEQRWSRRCRLLDASRGFQPSDDNDDDESSALTTGMKLLSSTNTKKRPLPTFPLEARHFGGYHGQYLNLSSNKSGDGLSRQPRIQSNNNKNTPKEFHHTLCEMIRNAKERVYVASLYIGPGTSSSSSSSSDIDCEEKELLDALSEISNNRNNNNKNNVSIKIILDENRALRPVPVPKSDNITDNDNENENENPTTTSSAEAVDRALRGKEDTSSLSSSSLYLFRVLPSTMIFSDLFSNTDTGNGNDVGNGTGGWNWLPNPLNEIAGVFHIKLYLVDDQLLLSGANLSVEYFRDRMDRYLHLIQGGNGLVDFYATLIEILCSHSKEYNKNYNDSETATDSKGRQGGQQHPQPPQPLRHPNQQQQQRETFLRDITEHFQDPTYDPSLSSGEFQSTHDLFTSNSSNNNNNSNSSNNDHNRNRIIAVGIPTFQAPVGFFRHHHHHHQHGNNTTTTTNNDDVNRNKRKITSMGRDVVSLWSTFRSLFRINKQPTDKVDFITDVEATLSLLRQAGVMNNSNNNTNNNTKTNYSIQLSSAYLNPTTTLLSILKNGFTKIELLTAGKVSHGFKPKEKKVTEDGDDECNQGKKGKNWTIPSIFQQLVHDCLTTLRSQSQSMMTDVRLYHWERPKWTFHAKGIWLREERQEKEQDTHTDDNQNTVIDSSLDGDGRNSNSTTAFNSTGCDNTGTTGTTDDTSSEVAAVVVGSSNFGYRSFCRDMESNLILVFPPSSSSSSSTSSTSSFSSSSPASTSTAPLSNSRSSNDDSQGNSHSNNEDNTTVNGNINDNDNTNTIAHAFGEEWNDLRATATEQQERDTVTTTAGTVTADKPLPPLSWPIRRALPYIKTFF